MVFLLAVGVLVGAWVLAVLGLARYLGTPAALVGAGESLGKWLKR